MVILGVGLAMAQEPATPDLPPLSPAELLARVAEQAPGTTAINGDFTWTNNLLGTTLPIPEDAEGLGAFLQSGSGRMWLQEEGARLESQTPQGDVVVVSDGATLWVYSSMQNKAWQYDLPQHQGENSSTTTSLPLDFPARVQDMIEELSSKASLEVLTERVAGRDAYVLVLTPTARNTVFGSAQVAFDAEHFVPLRAEVFSRYADDPVLAAGFTEVSFDAVDPSLFSFTPPADAQVQQKELTLPEKPAGSEGFGLGGKSERASSIEDAQEMAGFTLAHPRDADLAFTGARVFEAHQDASPVVLLTYGEGFGTVLLVQTKIDEGALDRLLEEMAAGSLGPGLVPEDEPGSETPTTEAQGGALAAALGALVQPVTVGGHPALQLDTQLGSAIAWQQGELGILVAGSLTPADLAAFAALVR
jgi:outer membrane lipoprotein-sorting protein